MREAIIAVVVLVVGVIIGTFIKPSVEQTRPLEPQAGAGGADSEESDTRLPGDVHE